MELCAVLLSWALHLSEFQAPAGQCPEIQRVSHGELERRACSGRPCKVLGWYPGSGDVIYVDDRLDIDNDLFHSSIVLHEIVHWLQGHAGTLLLGCAQSIAAEREAYHIQQQFLNAYGSYHPTGTVVPMMRCTPVEEPDTGEVRLSMSPA